MVKDINSLPNLTRPVTRKILQSKWQNIKINWKAWTFYNDHISGWGPNTDPSYGDLEVLVSLPEAMEAHFKKHTKYRKFQFEIPENYNVLKTLLGNRLADGRNVKSLKQLKASTSRSNETPSSSRSASRCVSRSVTAAGDESSEDDRPRLKKKKRVNLREQALNSAAAEIAEVKGLLQLRMSTILSRAMEKANQELGHDRVAKRELWDVFESS